MHQDFHFLGRAKFKQNPNSFSDCCSPMGKGWNLTETWRIRETREGIWPSIFLGGLAIVLILKSFRPEPLPRPSSPSHTVSPNADLFAAQMLGFFIELYQLSVYESTIGGISCRFSRWAKQIETEDSHGVQLQVKIYKKRIYT